MQSCTEPTRSTHHWRNRLIVFVLLHVIASGKISFAADFSDANLTGAHLTNVDFSGTPSDEQSPELDLVQDSQRRRLGVFEEVSLQPASSLEIPQS